MFLDQVNVDLLQHTYAHTRALNRVYEEEICRSSAASAFRHPQTMVGICTVDKYTGMFAFKFSDILMYFRYACMYLQ